MKAEVFFFLQIINGLLWRKGEKESCGDWSIQRVSSLAGETTIKGDKLRLERGVVVAFCGEKRESKLNGRDMKRKKGNFFQCPAESFLCFRKNFYSAGNFLKFL